MKQAEIVSLPRAAARRGPVRRRRQRHDPEIELTQALASTPERELTDAEFLPPAASLLATPPSRFAVFLGYTICAVIAAFVGWACVGRLGVNAVAPGIVEAAERTKVVEPRETGQIQAVHVNNGDHVAKGQLLVELEPTTALANRTVIADKLADLRAEIPRLQVEIAAAGAARIDTNASVRWDPQVPRRLREREERTLHADLSQLAAAIADLEAQRGEKEAERDKYTANIAAQKSLIATIDEHVAMHRQLAATGVESRAQLLDAEAKLQDARIVLTGLEGSLADAKAALVVIAAAITRTREDFLAKDAQLAAAAEREADNLAEQLQKASQVLEDMTLQAPISGTVQASAVTTVGQVVKPGQQLMQIVPDGSPLEITAYVLSRDIGFVRTGQRAIIKVDSFPYTRYGTIPGTVTSVGSDAIPGKTALQQQKNDSQPLSGGALSQTAAAEQTHDLVLPVTVAFAKSTIEVDGRQVPLAAGMSVVVEIETDKQSVLDYLMFPLLRGTQIPAAPGG